MFRILKRPNLFSYDKDKRSEGNKEIVRRRFQPTINFVEAYLKNVVDKMWTFRDNEQVIVIMKVKISKI